MLARMKPGVVTASFSRDLTFFTCMPAALTPTTLPLLTSARTSTLPAVWILCLPFCLILSPSRAFPLRWCFSLASVTPKAPMVLADAIIPSAVRRLIIGLLSLFLWDFQALDCLPGIIPSGLLSRASGPSPASRSGPSCNFAHGNLDRAQVASTRQLTARSGDQNDAVTVALNGDVSAIELYIGEITISGD